MHLCRDINKFEMATIGWFTHISTPTDREAVNMVAIAVTARFMFGLEEVNEASSAYLSTTMIERYIAFSSLTCQSESQSLSAAFVCFEQLTQYKTTRGNLQQLSAWMNKRGADTKLYAIYPATIMNIIPMAPHPISTHLSNAEDDQ